MQKIGGSIERVDHPGVVGIALRATFLRENRVIGIVFLNGVDDCPLGISIHFTDEIVATFLFDFDLVQFGQAANDCVAAAVRCHHGNI